MRISHILFISLITAPWLSATGAEISLAEHAAKILAAEDAMTSGETRPAVTAPAVMKTDAEATENPGAPASPPAQNSEAAPPPPTMSTATGFVSLGRLTFVHNKWELTEQTRRRLDAAALYLAQHPGASRLLIRGHTDEVGSIRFNDGLSDKRATAVQDYLISKGVPAEQIRWEGHGEHAPVDENWTRLGRARNRQVEIFAVYPPPLSASVR